MNIPIYYSVPDLKSFVKILAPKNDPCKIFFSVMQKFATVQAL